MGLLSTATCTWLPEQVRYSYGLPRTIALGTLGDVEPALPPVSTAAPG